MEKLRSNDRTHAVTMAVRRGLLQLWRKPVVNDGAEPIVSDVSLLGQSFYSQ